MRLISVHKALLRVRVILGLGTGLGGVTVWNTVRVKVKV
jgi:hypothetical protein